MDAVVFAGRKVGGSLLGAHTCLCLLVVDLDLGRRPLPFPVCERGA